MPFARRSATATVSGAFLVLLAGALPARAHNAKVHLAMTDRAYEIMLALSQGALDTGGDAGLAQLAADAGRAIDKLKRVPASLPAPRQTLCIDPEAIKKFGQNPPWSAPTPFESMTLGAVRFPITLEYITGNDCGVDP
jgi:hypothetical protein